MDLFKIKSFKFFIFFALGLLIFLQGIFMLPVLDRDEARFATATKNMLETGDFIDIELEGVKRYKKPIGIYWAQSLTTNLLGSEPYDKIWTYQNSITTRSNVKYSSSVFFDKKYLWVKYCINSNSFIKLFFFVNYRNSSSKIRWFVVSMY